jgi:hypothetical protein
MESNQAAQMYHGINSICLENMESNTISQEYHGITSIYLENMKSNSGVYFPKISRGRINLSRKYGEQYRPDCQRKNLP